MISWMMVQPGCNRQ